jgi:hypothetical protein
VTWGVGSAWLAASCTSGHRLTVSVIKTGHSQFVKGTVRVSNHYVGRAVDIVAVDGADVTAANDAALALAVARAPFWEVDHASQRGIASREDEPHR